VIYLSGGVRGDLDGRTGLGFMFTPNMGNAPRPGVPWAADSGLWSAKGIRVFDLDRYLAWLWKRRSYRADCLFATAPDVVGDAAATWLRSRHILPCLRGLGYPAALVAQDGWDGNAVDWGAFDCLFIGGTDEFKLAESTYRLIAEAKQRDKHVHMGRVNSGRRFRAAAFAGCDSVDGTYLAFGPDTNWPKLQRWLIAHKEQPSLWTA
jgi:hypothetical protein